MIEERLLISGVGEGGDRSYAASTNTSPSSPSNSYQPDQTYHSLKNLSWLFLGLGLLASDYTLVYLGQPHNESCLELNVTLIHMAIYYFVMYLLYYMGVWPMFRNILNFKECLFMACIQTIISVIIILMMPVSWLALPSTWAWVHTHTHLQT